MTATIRRKDPHALAKRIKGLQKAAGKEIAVGFPAGKAQAYPDGTSVIDVAAAHVYGVGVPQRDFMALAKPAIAEKTKDLLTGIAKATTAEGAEKLQNAAGLVAQECIREAIIALEDPPNAPATIAKKKSSNPLIDTGHMKDSVTHVVRSRRSR